MAVGDIYQLTSEVSIGEDKILNVFHYLQQSEDSATATQALSLNRSWRGSVWSEIRQMLSSSGTLTAISSFNLFDPVDIAENLPTGADLDGARSALHEPLFTAASFRSHRVRRDIRRGFKRFAPLPDASVVDGEWQDGGNDYFLLVQAALSIDITGGFPGVFADGVFRPVIVKRIKYIDSEGREKYRLPENVGEAEYFRANVWQFMGLTTQTTRKPGRGI